jgi:hypothetical protein
MNGMLRASLQQGFFAGFAVYFILLSILSCNSKESSVGSEEFLGDTISIFNDPDSVFAWPSLTESEIVRLETNDTTSFNRVAKLHVDKNQIFIHDDRGYRILVFEEDGSFHYDIDQRGRGPGEYIELHDFCFNQDHTELLLLDYKKIHFYDRFNGSFKRTESIKIPPDRGHNPVKFQLVGAETYYFYTGNSDGRKPMSGEYFRMFEYQDGHVNEYIPYTHKVWDGNTRFVPRIGYPNQCWMIPGLGDYYLYGLSESGITKEIYLDFNGMGLPLYLLEEYKELSAIDNSVKSNYFKGIVLFRETRQHMYFMIGGPLYMHELLVDKEDYSIVSFGRQNPTSPIIRFSDEEYFYGVAPVAPTKRLLEEGNPGPFWKQLKSDRLDEMSNDLIVKFKIE